MALNFLPYSRQFIDQADIDAVTTVLRSDWLTQGPDILAFEQEIAEYVGARFAVAVSSGTAALHLCYLAIGLGVGDEIVTTPNTFVATSNAALYCGAQPRFVDVDLETGLINCDLVEAMITPKTKALVPVDFAGCPSDLAPLYALAKKHGLVVIEDASHALGAKYRDSIVGDGTYADMTVFSFHPVKPITTGEGGMITTNDPALYEKLLRLRTHGITKTEMSQNPGPWYYEMTDLGFNYRMTDFQAALGRTQLAKLDGFVASRHETALRYDEAFKSLSNVRPLCVPDSCVSGHHLYVVSIDFGAIGQTRAEVMATLKEKGMGSQVHYIPVYHQPYYQSVLAEVPVCPVMEHYYRGALSIPLYPFMSDADVKRVIDAMCVYG